MAAPKTQRPDSNQAIGARLQLLRKAYGLAQGYAREINKSEFARLCGIGIQAWHNAESGYARIGLDNAIRVRTRTGAGLEFIYFDKRSDVPHAIAVAMAKLERAEAPARRA